MLNLKPLPGFSFFLSFPHSFKCNYLFLLWNYLTFLASLSIILFFHFSVFDVAFIYLFICLFTDSPAALLLVYLCFLFLTYSVDSSSFKSSSPFFRLTCYVHSTASTFSLNVIRVSFFFPVHLVSAFLSLEFNLQL